MIHEIDFSKKAFLNANMLKKFQLKTNYSTFTNIMERWTAQHRAWAFTEFYQNGSQKIKKSIENFEETLSTINEKTGSPKTMRIAKNI